MDMAIEEWPLYDNSEYSQSNESQAANADYSQVFQREPMRGHTTSSRIHQPIMAMTEQEDSNSMANLRQSARPNKGTRGPTLLEEQSRIDPRRPQPVQAPSGRVPVAQETIQEDEDLTIQLGELLAHITKAYLTATNISQGVEPLTYRQAVESPNSLQWKQAMEREMSSLKDNNTWNLVDLPSG